MPFDFFRSVLDELKGLFLVWAQVQSGPFSAALSANTVSRGDRVLLHVVRRSALNRAGLTEQFHEAVATAAALDHPGIVRVLDSGTSASFEWYSTQPVTPGKRLSLVLQEGGPLRGSGLIALVEQIADVLRYSHGMGVPHGHLSPATVFLNDEGRACVGEFCTRRVLDLVLRKQQLADSGPDAGNPEPHASLTRHDHLSLALLIHECVAGHALGTTSIESATTGAKLLSAEDFSDLERRLQSSGALPEGEAAALNLLFSGISKDHHSLPTVRQIAAQLGLHGRDEADTPVSTAVTKVDENLPDLQEDEWMVFPGEPEPQKRRVPLMVTVVITVVVTWLAAQTLPLMGKRNAGITPFATAGTMTAGDGNVQPELSSGSASVAGAATSSQPPPPDGRAKTDSPQVIPPAMSTGAGAGADSLSQRSTSAASAVPIPARSGPTGTQSSSAKSAKTTSDSTRAAQARPGSLFISTRPWGYLYLDERPIGNTPANDVSISVGVHTLRVEREGFLPYEAQITVLPGQQIRLVDIILSRRNP